MLAVAGAALPAPSCGQELNELEENVMVITAASIWNLGGLSPSLQLNCVLIYKL